MKRNCVNCSVKDTCLTRSLGIFLLYIQTGRFNELTEDVRENFNCASNCNAWTRIKEKGGNQDGNSISIS